MLEKSLKNFKNCSTLTLPTVSVVGGLSRLTYVHLCSISCTSSAVERRTTWVHLATVYARKILLQQFVIIINYFCENSLGIWPSSSLSLLGHGNLLIQRLYILWRDGGGRSGGNTLRYEKVLSFKKLTDEKRTERRKLYKLLNYNEIFVISLPNTLTQHNCHYCRYHNNHR